MSSAAHPQIEPINRQGLRPKFWERVPLKNMSNAEWEALCDGCGKCCLNKLEDEDTNEVAFTRISCRLLDCESARCCQYEIRHQFVPECVQLTPQNISKIAYWMPASCAYRLIYDGKPLYDWHPLISGNTQSVDDAGHSVRGWCIPEFEIPEEEWENHIIEEPC